MATDLIRPRRSRAADRSGSAGARLRRGAALASAAILGALLTAFAAVTFANGGGWGDLAAPLAGAVLAFAAEMLCLDVAIRRVEKLSTRTSRPDRGCSRAPVGA